MASPTKNMLSFTILATFAASFTLTHASPLYTACVNSNFTSGSRYGANINNLFSSLSSSTGPSSSPGFYNLTYGRSPDAAYTLGLCRGDLSPQACQSCIRNATSDLPQECGNRKAGIIWYDECMLRYSNQSMYGRMETEPAIYLYNVNNVSNPSRFDEMVGNLLDSLRKQAISGRSFTKFATGNVAASNLPRVYALVQCTPDLNATSCDNCLNDILQGLPQCCGGKQGGRMLGPSCNFRYEIEQFYAAPDSSDAPTPAAEPPPDSAVSPTPGAEPASPPPAASAGMPPPAQPSDAANAPSAAPSTPASAANTIGKKSTGVLAVFVALLVV